MKILSVIFCFVCFLGLSCQSGRIELVPGFWCEPLNKDPKDLYILSITYDVDQKIFVEQVMSRDRKRFFRLRQVDKIDGGIKRQIGLHWTRSSLFRILDLGTIRRASKLVMVALVVDVAKGEVQLRDVKTGQIFLQSSDIDPGLIKYGLMGNDRIYLARVEDEDGRWQLLTADHIGTLSESKERLKFAISSENYGQVKEVISARGVQGFAWFDNSEFGQKWLSKLYFQGMNDSKPSLVVNVPKEYLEIWQWHPREDGVTIYYVVGDNIEGNTQLRAVTKSYNNVEIKVSSKHFENVDIAQVVLPYSDRDDLVTMSWGGNRGSLEFINLRSSGLERIIEHHSFPVGTRIAVGYPMTPSMSAIIVEQRKGLDRNYFDCPLEIPEDSVDF